MPRTFTLIFLLSLFTVSFSFGQNHKNYKITTDENAKYPGGDTAFAQYIYDNMEFPPEASKKGVKGIVQVSFYVMPDGKTTDVRALNDLGYGTKQEAERLIKQAAFEPAVVNGRKSKQHMMVGVNF